MLLSSSCRGVGPVAGLVGLSGAEDGVEDVDAASGKGDEGLVVSFALGAFAGVEGLAGGIALPGAERGLVEDELQCLAAGGGSAQVAHLAGLLEDEGSLPHERTERRAHDLVAQGFARASTDRSSLPSTSRKTQA